MVAATSSDGFLVCRFVSLVKGLRLFICLSLC